MITASKIEQTQPARMKRQQQAHVIKSGRSEEFRMYMDLTGEFVSAQACREQFLYFAV